MGLSSISSQARVEWRRRRAKARQAIVIVLERVALLRPSTAVVNLRLRAGGALDSIRGLNGAIPTPAQQERLLERVVRLDLTTTALERVERWSAPSRRHRAPRALSVRR